VRKRTTIRFSSEIQERIYQIRAELVNSCEICDGSGYVPAEEERSVYRCDCMIIFRYIKELVKANIPSDYWKLILESLQIDSAAKEMVGLFIQHIDTAKKKGLGLVLLGSNGTGKTASMCEIGKEAIIQGYDVRYFSLSSYLNSLFEKDELTVKNMEFGDFLLVDELDKRGGNIAKAVDEFLRRMFNLNRSMILATNWDREELIKKLGESVYSLLMRRCEFVEIEGKDFSTELNESFIRLLQNDFDYWNKGIKKMAMRREEKVY